MKDSGPIFLFCCALLAIAPMASAAEALFIAEPSMDAVFYKPLGSADGEATLLSGSVPFRSRTFAYFGKGERAFAGNFTQRIFIQDANGITESTDFPAGEFIAAISPGNAMYPLIVATGDGRVARLYGLKRDGVWITDLLDTMNEAFEVAPTRLDAAVLGSGRLVWRCGKIARLSNLSGTSFSPMTIANLSGLIPGPEDQFVALKAKFKSDFTFSYSSALYDGTGTLISSFEADSGSALSTNPSAAMWFGTTPELVTTNVQGLIYGISPADGGTSTSLALAGDGEFEYSTSLRAGNEGQWRSYSELGGSEFLLDPAGGKAEVVFAMEAGSGPPLLGPRAITLSENRLYLLDNLDEGPRIVEVDTFDGNRRVVGELPRKNYLPYLDSHDGKLLIVSSERAPDGFGPYTIRAWRVSLEGTATPTLAEVHAVQSFALPVDTTTDTQGVPRYLFPFYCAPVGIVPGGIANGTGSLAYSFESATSFTLIPGGVPKRTSTLDLTPLRPAPNSSKVFLMVQGTLLTPNESPRFDHCELSDAGARIAYFDNFGDVAPRFQSTGFQDAIFVVPTGKTLGELTMDTLTLTFRVNSWPNDAVITAGLALDRTGGATLVDWVGDTAWHFSGVHNTMTPITGVPGDQIVSAKWGSRTATDMVLTDDASTAYLATLSGEGVVWKWAVGAAEPTPWMTGFPSELDTTIATSPLRTGVLAIGERQESPTLGGGWMLY